MDYAHTGPAAGPADGCLEEERRAAPRLASDRVAACWPATVAGAFGTLARVKDVSTAGIGLVLDRRFEPGTLLAVQVEAACGGGPGNLLARVRRVMPQEGGQWLLGCAFVSPLGAEELHAFLTGPEQGPAPDRRAWVRTATDFRALCRSRSRNRNQSGQRLVKVVDISAKGVGLLAPDPLEEGERLTVVLPAEGGRAARVLLARVVRREVRPEQQWLLGCEILGEC
jgi:hypothetical protein